MADLLLEIGCEEIPSSFVAGALTALPTLLAKRFAAQRIAHGAIEPLGSPRRISVRVMDVSEQQPDVTEELTGPPASAAYDKEGKPTKGAEAFAKKLGVDVSMLRLVETPKGKYVAGTRQESGRRTIDILPKLLEEAIAEIPFRKSMRWGAGEVAFGRPIHWIVALFGSDLIPLSYAGIHAGRQSFGHRFLAPAGILIESPRTYVDQLAAAHVQVDVQARRTTMLERLRVEATKLGGTLQEDAFLTEENVGLVEEAFIVAGSFEAPFLALPDRLILDVMRTHQRYFGVRDKNGVLLPVYLAVVNTALDPVTICRGNNNVMRARLSDARFFVDTDRKAGLAKIGEKLAGIRYHAKLGSMADKVARISRIAALIVERMQLGPDEMTLDATVQRAASLCKNDLAALTVGEFPEMQGHAGRDIALATGESADVANAIADHWLEPDAMDHLGAAGTLLGLADKLDHLVAGFAVGLAPTGANDPFSMRRAFNRTVLAYVSAESRQIFDKSLSSARPTSGGSVKLPSLLRMCEFAYQAAMEGPMPLPRGWQELEGELLAFMRARLVGLFDVAVDVAGASGFIAPFRAPKDVVEACIDAEPAPGARTAFDDLFDLRARIAAVRDARGTEDFAKLSTAFKRASKITKGIAAQDPDPGKMDHPAETALWTAFAQARTVIAHATESGDYAQAVELTSKALAQPIDTFFDKDNGVFVMADDLAVRDNRLRMLATIAGALRRVAKLEALET